MPRKPSLTSLEQVESLVKKYKQYCDGDILADEEGCPLLDKNGGVIYLHPHPPTITGLALALGFKSRGALLKYEAKETPVGDAITRAKSWVEQYAEERLFDKDGQRGAAFALSHNFRWVEPGKNDDSSKPSGGVIVMPRVEGVEVLTDGK